MKIFKNFTEEKRTEKAIFISVFIEEFEKDMKIWLPLSKVEINGNSISIKDDFWKSKLQEEKEKETEKEKKVSIHCLNYEEVENSIKIIFEVELKEKKMELWGWVAKKLVENIEDTSDENFKFIIIIPKWTWDNCFKNSVEKQLDFYNKESEIYSADDFVLTSKVEEL